MPQSLASILVHLVFSTKHRKRLITPDIEPELYKYMASVFIACQSPAILIGGDADHIHSLFVLSRKFTIAKIVEEIKTSTSKWIKTKGEEFNGFSWQSGYGAFSIGQSGVDIVKQYITNQKVHHRRQTFQEEFLELLTRYQLQYDEKYVWD